MLEKQAEILKIKNKLSQFNDKSCVVACSGGPDSMVLLSLIVSAKFKRVIVCHVNYHAREDSNYDTKLVSEYCNKNNIELLTKHVYPSERPKNANFQAWARDIRYDFFCKTARQNNISQILVGHHLDDYLETYLLQKNANKLVDHYGLKETSDLNGEFKLIRPLLTISKMQILEYVVNHNLKFAQDSSNLLPKYERNKIRIMLKKFSMSQKKLLVDEITVENQNLVKIKTEANQIIKNHLVSKNVLCNITELYEKQHDVLIMVIYYFLVETIGFKNISRKKSLINEIYNQVFINKSKKILINLNDKFYISLSYNNLIIIPSSVLPSKHYCYVITRHTKYLSNQAFSLLGQTTVKFQENNKTLLLLPDEKYYVKPIQKHDMIETISGSKKVNRIFIDNKIPYLLRDIWPGVYTIQGKLIAIPLLAFDKSVFGKSGYKLKFRFYWKLLDTTL